VAEEMYPELSDDGEAISRNAKALNQRLEWLVDRTWRAQEAYPDEQAGTAEEFAEHCDIVSRFADGAASVLQPGVYSHTAFSDCRDEAAQGAYQFRCVDGADAEQAKAYLYEGWSQCKKAMGTLTGIT